MGVNFTLLFNYLKDFRDELEKNNELMEKHLKVQQEILKELKKQNIQKQLDGKCGRIDGKN